MTTKPVVRWAVVSNSTDELVSDPKRTRQQAVSLGPRDSYYKLIPEDQYAENGYRVAKFELREIPTGEIPTGEERK